ncbi:MAG: hypothetical protein JNJ83_03260 [Verrucomicrobiaceae bacterium]|nr:hypothetical protein [Verrucomicrobiaceae bacterium]
MADQQWDKLWFKTADITSAVVIESEELKEVVTSFTANVFRVGRIVGFPAFLAGLSARYQSAIDLARLEELGRLFLSEPESKDVELLNRLRERKELHIKNSMIADIEQNKMGDFLRQGGDLFKEIMSLYDTDEDAKSIFNSLILSAWTTMETMLGDLWETSVNVRPTHLSVMDGKRQATKKSRADDDDGEQIDTKSIPLKDVYRHNLDLSKSLGTILKGNLKFVNLGSVVKAYLQSFYTDADEIHKLIQEESLLALFIMRNAIVHKAGKVDVKFMSERGRAKVALAKWQGLTLHDSIEIDGNDVRGLIEPAFKTGATLIVEVDKWIKNHPEPRSLYFL